MKTRIEDYSGKNLDEAALNMIIHPSLTYELGKSAESSREDFGETIKGAEELVSPELDDL